MVIYLINGIRLIMINPPKLVASVYVQGAVQKQLQRKCFTSRFTSHFRHVLCSLSSICPYKLSITHFGLGSLKTALTVAVSSRGSSLCSLIINFLRPILFLVFLLFLFFLFFFIFLLCIGALPACLTTLQKHRINNILFGGDEEWLLVSARQFSSSSLAKERGGLTESRILE